MRDPLHPSRARAVVVTMPTEIDISNAGRIGEELCAAFAPGVTTVIADMTGTRFCDSSGISMLVVAHQKAVTSDAELRLVAVSSAVLRALTLVRIDHLLTVYPSLADALLPGPPPNLPGPPPKTGPARLSGRRAATFPYGAVLERRDIRGSADILGPSRGPNGAVHHPLWTDPGMRER